MIIFVDLGLIAILAIIIGGIIVGTIMSVTQWMLANLPFITCAVFVKALIELGMTGILKKNPLQGIVCILIDMLRSALLIWVLVDGVLTGFSGGLLQLVATAFGLIIGFPIFLLAYSIGLYLEIEEPLIRQIVSAVAMGLCCLILYGIFNGW